MDEVYVKVGEVYTVIPVWSFYYRLPLHTFPTVTYDNIPIGGTIHIQGDGEWEVITKKSS